MIRTIKDIRTRTSLLNAVFAPHKAYMAITSLEMEKFRRKIEQKNLLVRLNGIEERLKDIDKEKTALISRLAKEKDHKGVKSLIRSSLPAHNPPPSTRSGGLRYAY